MSMRYISNPSVPPLNEQLPREIGRRGILKSEIVVPRLNKNPIGCSCESTAFVRFVSQHICFCDCLICNIDRQRFSSQEHYPCAITEIHLSSGRDILYPWISGRTRHNNHRRCPECPITACGKRCSIGVLNDHQISISERREIAVL